MNLRRRLDNEEGASATLFAIVLLMLLAVAVLAVDGGNLYVSQRGQASDTDAAALAGARLLAEDPCATESSVIDAAEDLLENSTALVDGTLDVSPDACTERQGVVTVDTTRDVSFFFAPIFGDDQAPTVVRSQAAFGPADVLTGVRPIAICSQDLHYQEWTRFFPNGSRADYNTAVGVTNDTYEEAYRDSGVSVDPHPTGDYPGAQDHVHRITFQRLKTNTDSVATGDCPDADGDSAGNWGWLDFNGTGKGYCEDGVPGSNDLPCRVREGFEGPISLLNRDCNAEDPSIRDCPAIPGGRGASTAMSDIVCPSRTAPPTQCEQLLFVIYDTAPPPGRTGDYTFNTVATAVLRGYEVGTGRDFNKNPEASYIDLEFVDTPLPQQVIGGSDPGGTRPMVYQLCGARDFSNCTP